MGQLVTEQNKLLEEVDSLFVSLSDETWLIPMSAVAEVVHFVDFETQPEDPVWLKGWMEWRQQRIPLVTFETIASNGDKRDVEGSLVLVMNTLNSASEFSFYAVLIQDFPHSVRISEEDLLQEIAGGSGLPFALMRVGLDENVALIPDLKKLEQYLSEHL